MLTWNLERKFKLFTQSGPQLFPSNSLTALYPCNNLIFSTLAVLPARITPSLLVIPQSFIFLSSRREIQSLRSWMLSFLNAWLRYWKSLKQTYSRNCNGCPRVPELYSCIWYSRMRMQRVVKIPTDVFTSRNNSRYYRWIKESTSYTVGWKYNLSEKRCPKLCRLARESQVNL